MASSIARSRVPTMLNASSRAYCRPCQSVIRPGAFRWRANSYRQFSYSSILLEKKYTEEHEWVELSPDGKTGTIGITKYAANQLGDVVYVELPQVDLSLKKGDSLGAVESVKSASDILTPVSGNIIETNSVLEEKPATINKGPEAEGWIAKIELKDMGELDSLMDAKRYTSFTEESESESS